MSRPSIRQRFFAWMLNKGESENEKIYRQIKASLFRDIHGTVVEIGPGTGVNFNYFPEDIDWIGLEPNEAFHENMLKKAASKNINARLINSVAEKIDLPDESADMVISTLVLCSVKNMKAALQEIKRVLKKGGRLIFIEHVAAPKKTGRRKVQQLFNPLNRFMADGCNCTRETWVDIEQAGFSSVHLRHETLNGTMAVFAPHIFGYAIK
ncbi:MAG: class I SAM-dependent methyltransferase [Bacteroidota bacterium]|nr:class I SAM-dependent methyltransferase [Bacteroidota bacterium]